MLTNNAILNNICNKSNLFPNMYIGELHLKDWELIYRYETNIETIV